MKYGSGNSCKTLEMESGCGKFCQNLEAKYDSGNSCQNLESGSRKFCQNLVGSKLDKFMVPAGNHFWTTILADLHI